ncbi:hypothetical protein ACFQGT_13470 [Natrialbaceae archaeon GCM10025810]|uniref:DUF7551 domain-containing protein n=1 Tax=Halovalidus salilacus TaxID=3075124 RepID=UPI0036107008
MVGTTLREIREHVETLSSDDGAYYVVCGRSGVRPAPVAGERFETRHDAVAAARATEQYRAALRRYDPDLPYYDPIVCEGIPGSVAEESTEADAPAPGEGRSSAAADGDAVDVRLPAELVSFCHDVVGAVFETLSADGHEAVERAVVDTYLAAAEAATDRHALCLVLLDSMARELDRHLSEAEGVEVLSRAAKRLAPAETDEGDPVEASLAFLRSRSMVSTYDVTVPDVEPDDGTGENRVGDDRDDGSTWIVTLGGYALERTDGWFPTLPIGVDLLRRAMASPVSVVRARRLAGGGWRLVVTDDQRHPSGLIGVPSEGRG